MRTSKAWLRFGEEYLLQRVVRVFTGTLEPVLVVSAPGQQLPCLPDNIEIVRDRVSDRGPLEALATGLEAISTQADAAFVSGCDAPFLRPGFVRCLVRLAVEADITVPHEEGRLHPLAAVYRVRVLPVIQELLDAGTLRLTALTERCSCRSVPGSALRDVDPELESLRNINTPEEYRNALSTSGIPWGD
ncbi:MAG: molybdenum cofactor guanylyltransferase [Candidatus Latescibacteria bacterium]|nr:molybdenum cofactor guanylyltransferase [Candidatus Latescibacterota bacterium]